MFDTRSGGRDACYAQQEIEAVQQDSDDNLTSELLSWTYLPIGEQS